MTPLEAYEDAKTFVHELQDKLCQQFENSDGKEKFREDLWDYPTGGGGRSRVIHEGEVFEKGGVNVSAVEGNFPEEFVKQNGFSDSSFKATGVSLVIHPVNPYVPTFHANYRMITCGEGDMWYGGGCDLTPYYIDEKDVLDFHKHLKAICDRHDAEYYPKYKKACDEYFYLPHRGETRGVGGLFFDYLKEPFDKHRNFWKDLGSEFIQAYIDIVEDKKHKSFSEREKEWQWIRRGRYAEFNLMYDRGTIFGLKTGGRTESILMSLPPHARWVYDHHPEAGSDEAKLLEFLKARDWLSELEG